jgi:hypothetical protein
MGLPHEVAMGSRALRATDLCALDWDDKKQRHTDGALKHQRHVLLLNLFFELEVGKHHAAERPQFVTSPMYS